MAEIIPSVNQEPIIPLGLEQSSTPVSESNKQELLSQAVIGTTEDITDKANDALVFGGEDSLRDVVSSIDYDEKRLATLGAISESLISDSSDVIARQMIASTVIEQNKYALEDKAVESLSKVPQEILDVVDASIIDDIAKDEAFNLKVRNFIAKYKDAEDKEGFLEEIPDFIKTILPLETVERVLFGGGAETITHDLRGHLQFAKNLPIEKQEEYLETKIKDFIEDIELISNNPNTIVELMESAADGSDLALRELELFQMLDVVLGAFDFEFAKGLKGLSIAQKLGNHKTIADDALKNPDERSIIKSDTDVLKAVSSLRHPFDSAKGVSEEISKKLEKNRRVMNDLLDNFTAPESMAQLENRHIADFESSYGANRVLDSNITIDERGSIDFTVGTSKGLPFKTEATASKWIKDKGIEGEVVKRRSGGYAVKMTTNLYGIDSTVSTNLSWFGKNFGNINNVISKSVVAGGQAVEGAMNSVFQMATDVHKNSMAILGKKKGKSIIRVINDGIDKDVWLSPNELRAKYRQLNGNEIGDEEIEAYFAYKQLNDFDYELKVDRARRESIAKGEKQVELDSGFKYNASPVDFERIYDEAGKTNPVFAFDEKIGSNGTFGKGKLSKDQIEELKGTHNLMRLSKDDSLKFFDNGMTTEPVKYVLTPKTSKLSKVNYNDLYRYKAGGRRRNNSPAYLKVGIIKNGSSGSVRMPDIAMFGATSKKKAKEVSKNLQEIYTKLKSIRADGGEIKQLDELVSSKNLGAIGIHTAREADTLFDSYKLYDYDGIRFDGVRDRELVALDENVPVNLIDETDDPVMSGIRNEMNGRRGDRLKNLDGEDSIILDPLAALADSLETTARLASVQGYRENVLNFMKQTFGKYLVHEDSANPIELLSAGIKPQYQKQRGLVNAIQAHQQYATEIISKRTGWEETFLQRMESFVNASFDRGAEIRKGLQDGWVEKGRARQASLKIATKDPAGRLKNLVFNAKLGMFNPGSFIMQAINMTNIVALSPKYGSKAAMMALPLRLALAGGVDDSMLKQIANGWKVAGFKSQEDFIEYVKEFKRLGSNMIGRGIAEISGANGAQLGSSKIGAVAEAGRFFFREGELLSRATSYGAARLRWLDDKKVNPRGLSASSPEGRLWIQGESHRLSLGYSTADVQLGMRGLSGIPFQFWSYPFRLVGAMLPKLNGGSAFTGMEQSRLALAQLVLYGSAGIPIVDNLVNYYTANNPDLSHEEAKALTSGAIDSLIYELSEGNADTNFAGRAGIGQFFTDMARTFRDKGAFEVIAGAGGNNFIGMTGALYDTITNYAVFSRPSWDTVTEAGWTILKAEISSLKNLDKVLTAREFGYLYTKYGQRYAKISDMEAYLLGLGFPPNAYEKVSLTFDSDNERKDAIKRYSTIYLSLGKKIDDALASGDRERAINLQQTLNIVGKQAEEKRITDDVIRAVIKAETSEDLLTTRSRRMQNMYGGVGTNYDVIRKKTKDKE